MPLLLLIAFIAVPIVELVVIGAVSDRLGLGWTLFLLLADSVAGAVLVRHEGRRAWSRFRSALTEARWPGDEVVQGALVLVGGALLLTPGFVTDGVGLALVLPVTRRPVAAVLRRWLTPGPLRGFGAGDGGTAGGDAGDGSVLDVEVIAIERDDGDEWHAGDGGRDR